MASSKNRRVDLRTGVSPEPEAARTADVEHEAATADPGTHTVVEPTEADYERARTVGIGNEPELPPGKVENGSTVRANSQSD